MGKHLGGLTAPVELKCAAVASVERIVYSSLPFQRLLVLNFLVFLRSVLVAPVVLVLAIVPDAPELIAHAVLFDLAVHMSSSAVIFEPVLAVVVFVTVTAVEPV